MTEIRGKPLHGEWWEPDRPGDIYNGVLQVEESNHGTLTLRGTDSRLATLPISGKQRTFLGRLTERRPQEISLLEAGMMQGPHLTLPSSPDRGAVAEFYTNSIVLGAHVLSEDDSIINGARLHLTGLKDWCDATGLIFEHENWRRADTAPETISVSFQPSTSPLYDLGNGRSLRFLSEYGGSLYANKRKQITLNESNRIELRFSDSVSIKELMNEIHIWQSFITFGLRRPSYAESIVLLLEHKEETFPLASLLVPGRRQDALEEQKQRHEVLFSQSKLGSNLSEYLRSWRQKYEITDAAVLLLSGATYQDAVYIHTNLLTYLQALEILHRELFVRDRFPDSETKRSVLDALRAAVPVALDECLKKEITMQIGYIGNLTLLDRLKHLYAMYPKSVGPLFRSGNADMILLKNVRNFLTHYGDQKHFDKDFLWTREIFVLKEKSRFFVEICLLGAIGMSDQDIHQLLVQFEPYLEWCAE